MSGSCLHSISRWLALWPSALSHTDEPDDTHPRAETDLDQPCVPDGNTEDDDSGREERERSLGMNEEMEEGKRK